MLKQRLIFLCVIVIAGTLHAKTQEEYKKYQQKILRDPSLLRFYTFEEGRGAEVRNHTDPEPGRTAITGGPFGSLSIIRPTPYGWSRTNFTHRNVDPEPPEWTKGRWNWKSALRIGNAAYSLGRSQITGKEFEHVTFSGWLRVHDGPSGITNSIFGLGNAHNNGFRLDYQRPAWQKKGRLEFRIGGKSPVTVETSPFVPGVWHHFAVTLDGKKIRLYVDGALRNEKDITGKIIPAITERFYNPAYRDMEYRIDMRWFKLGFKPRRDQQTGVFDLDEFALYKRALSTDEIRELELAGRPELSPEKQIEDWKSIVTERAVREKIKLRIPLDSEGFFRIGKSIPVTADIPANTGLKGTFDLSLHLETLMGKTIFRRNLKLIPGKKETFSFTPPECGIYYLDMVLADSKGTLVKRLPERFTLGIVPLEPERLTKHNPVAFWASRDSFSYDTALRRMSIPRWDKNALFFLKDYKQFKKLSPDLRMFVCFDYPTETGKRISEKSRKEFTEYYQKCAEILKNCEGVTGIELTSEPRKISPEVYTDLIKIASPIFREALPGVLIFPPGGAPPTLPFINRLLELGAVPYIDGISYHSYLNNPVYQFKRQNPVDRIKKMLAGYPQKKLTYWNTESRFGMLPRMPNGRPMTRTEARAAGYPRSNQYGFETFTASTPVLPEEESAAFQVHAILTELASGYQCYTICSSLNSVEHSPAFTGTPSLPSVAVTALAGQVLNNRKSVTNMPLSSLDMLCMIVENTDGSRTAAVFGLRNMLLNFQTAPDTAFRVMDMAGNFSLLKSDSNGMLLVKASKNPVYIFGIPANFQEITPLKLTIPAKLPESQILNGELTVLNPFHTVLEGTLSAVPVRGAEITLSRTKIKLAPRKQEKIAVSLKSTALKSKTYSLLIELKNGSGQRISAAEVSFLSTGNVYKVLRAAKPFPLDCDETKWKNVPETFCDDVDDVVHGIPNFAELWLPQWRNTDDLSFALKTAWVKNDGLYFLLKVRDNKVVPAPDGENRVFLYDCLEFFLDTRSGTNLGKPVSDGADQMLIVPQTTSGSRPCRISYARGNNAHMTVSCVGKKIRNGYILEGKVTPNSKSLFRLLPGSTFMMDFLIDDTDEPVHLRKAAMALHGTFNNNISVANWGRYELSLERIRE